MTSGKNQDADSVVLVRNFSLWPRPSVPVADVSTGRVPVGLSSAHISPRSDGGPSLSSSVPEAPSVPDAVYKVAIGGQLAKLKGPPVRPGPGGLRGKIKTFSRGSRRRLMELFASLDKRDLETPLLVTLTYPGAFEDFTPEDWKDHLDNFCKALFRKWREASVIWRLEFQQRGAPHYHLLVFNVRYIPREWVASTWFRVVGSGDERHLKAGTEVRKAKSWRSAASYVSKYLAKVDGLECPVGNPGRFWGIKGRKRLPVEVVEVVLELPEFYRIRRVMRKWLAKRGYTGSQRRGQGISLFLDWLAALRLIELVV